MIRSMTGYGHFEETVNGRKISTEIKSVNQRFTDFNIKMPRQFGFLEEPLRKAASRVIKRGKVDISVSVVDYNEDSVTVCANTALAKSYYLELSRLSEELGIENNAKVTNIATFPEMFKVDKPSVDEEGLVDDVLSVFGKALSNFERMRSEEGARLGADLLEKGKVILSYVDKITERMPMIVKAYSERLRTKMEEILSGVPVDEARLLNEVAIFTDKINVDEEMVRLKSHIAELSTIINGNEAAGRKLDFLIQEINREVNTTGSKANDVETTKMVVELKTEIEKMREQIQNIE